MTYMMISICVVLWTLTLDTRPVEAFVPLDRYTGQNLAPATKSLLPFESYSHSLRLAASATKEVDCLVVGSGVSGSCLAFNLVKHQNIENVLMVERNENVGGNLISKENDEGFVWEEGPNSFQPTSYICRIVHELNITDELVLADGSLPRFVYWKGAGAGEKLANLHGTLE